MDGKEQDRSALLTEALARELSLEDLYNEVVDVSLHSNVLYCEAEDSRGLDFRQRAYLYKLIDEIDKQIQDIDYIMGAYPREFDMVLEIIPFQILEEKFVYAYVLENVWKHVIYKYEDIDIEATEFVELK